MRLIVGLGNPDPEYQWTPHNLGFMAVDELANRNGIRVERPEGKALVGRGKIAGEEVILAKPQTYMNLSGISVRELLGKAELEVAAEMIGEAGDAVEMILSQGLDAAMTKYNRRKPAEPEEPAEE